MGGFDYNDKYASLRFEIKKRLPSISTVKFIVDYEKNYIKIHFCSEQLKECFEVILTGEVIESVPTSEIVEIIVKDAPSWAYSLPEQPTDKFTEELKQLSIEEILNNFSKTKLNASQIKLLEDKVLEALSKPYGPKPKSLYNKPKSSWLEGIPTAGSFKPSSPTVNPTSNITRGLKEILPAITAKVKYPCQTYQAQEEKDCLAVSHEGSLDQVIMHLNDSHRWTREQIADWLESLDIDLQFKNLEEVTK